MVAKSKSRSSRRKTDRWQTIRFVFTDDLDAHSLHGFQIIIEAARGRRCGIDRQPETQMRLGRPLARSAAHGHTGEQYSLPLAGSLLQAPVDDHGRGGHNQLEAILKIELGIVKEDVLRTGADVDGEDFHRICNQLSVISNQFEILVFSSQAETTGAELKSKRSLPYIGL